MNRILRLCVLAMALVGFGKVSFAQLPDGQYLYDESQGVKKYYTTGAQVYAGQLVVRDSTGNVEPVTAGATSGVIGVALQRGPSGATILVGVLGVFPVSTDGNCAFGNQVGISATSNGNGTCASSVNGQLIGAAGDNSAGYTKVNISPLTTAGASSGGMVYPGAGVPNSTGAAWGTSYAVGTGDNDLVQLNSTGQLPAVSGALLTNLPAPTGVPLANLASQSANTVVANVASSAGAPAAVAIPSGVQNYVAGTGYNQATGHQIHVPLDCADSSGSGTAQSCTTTPTFTPASPDCIVYTTTTTNSGTGLTTNVDSLGAKSIAIAGASGWTTTLIASIIPANKPILMCYDGTNWDAMQTGTAASSGGSSGLPLLNTAITRFILPVRSGGITNTGEGGAFTVTGGSSGDGAATTTTPMFDDINTAVAFTSSCGAGCVSIGGAGAYAAQVSGTIYQAQVNFPTNIATNTARYYVGLCAGCGGSANPVLSQALPTGEAGVYVRWSTTDSDAAPICVTSSGSATHTYTPSPAITPNQYNKLEFDDNGTSWTLKVNGTAVCSAMATNIPASGTTLAFIDGATPATANAVHTFFYGFEEIGQ
jgi:hypothetical protein